MFENCILNTKDAFWHAKNVTVRNSTLKGEYLAWFSEGLTLINCKIIGTQPVFYCKDCGKAIIDDVDNPGGNVMKHWYDDEVRKGHGVEFEDFLDDD